MAHFAKLDKNNVVLDVIVVNNEDILDSEGIESSDKGIQLLNELFGSISTWVQTSYNSTFRGSYAVVGGSYDSVSDIFMPIQPYPSWTFDLEANVWVSPAGAAPSVEMDDFGLEKETYHWAENNLVWESISYPKAHYVRYADSDDSIQTAFVSVMTSFITFDGVEDDSIGIEIASEDSGAGDWRRVPARPEGTSWNDISGQWV
jgi:hypothetical protein